MNTPDPDYIPPNAPVNEPPGEDRGSLMAGFLLGWAVLVTSWIVMAVIWALLLQAFSNHMDWVSPVISLLGLFPFVSMIALLVWFAAKGKTRSAAGVGLTFASLIGLALLLVAACFGLFMTGSHHF